MSGTQPVNLVKIEAQVVWRFGRDPDNGDWIAVCDELHMTAIGDTIIELQECANEAVALLFTDLLEEGELDSFLRINGWNLLTPLPSGPRPGVTFDVPQDFRRTSVRELVPA